MKQPIIGIQHNPRVQTDPEQGMKLSLIEDILDYTPN